MVSMTGYENRLSHQLSGGQQQRVSIARALANKPDIILADEPTGNLDTRTGSKVMEFLTDLNKKGRTIIIVTHDPEIARNYSKTIYSIRDGKIESLERKIGGKWKKISLSKCIIRD